MFPQDAPIVTDRDAVDELLRNAEQRTADGEAERFNETNVDYTIVFGRTWTIRN